MGANYVAGGNVRVSRFVKSDTSDDFQVLEADANERVIGISQEGAREAPLPNVTLYAGQDGDNMQVYQQGDICLLTLGSGGATRGSRLKSDADGAGVEIAAIGATQQFYGALALESGLEGEKIRVQVEIGQLYPALS